MPPNTDPINLNFPETIQTERLLIRPPRLGDGDALNEAVCESLDHLKPWMPWAQTAPTVEESESFVRKKAAQFTTREDLTLLIFNRESGRLLGSTGFHRINWSVPHVEIGYWLRAGETGKGYITEAVRGMTDFAFQHFDAERIEIRCDSRNKASAAVAERTGYTLEGCLRHDDRDTAGNLRNTLVYSMIRSEWEQHES